MPTYANVYMNGGQNYRFKCDENELLELIEKTNNLVGERQEFMRECDQIYQEIKQNKQEVDELYNELNRRQQNNVLKS